MVGDGGKSGVWVAEGSIPKDTAQRKGSTMFPSIIPLGGLTEPHKKEPEVSGELFRSNG